MKQYPLRQERHGLLSLRERAERFLLPEKLSIKQIGELLTNDEHERRSFYADLQDACQDQRIKYSGNLDELPPIRFDVLENVGPIAFVELAEHDYFNVVDPHEWLIHRDDLKAYLQSIGYWPVENCLLLNWWVVDLQELNPKAKQTNEAVIASNDITFSGLLKVPKGVDDWFQVIDDMALEFHKEFGGIPNKAQTWTRSSWPIRLNT